MNIEHAGSSSLKGKRFFILEDNPSNLKIMQVALENVGVTCVFDRWGRQTVQKLLAAMPVDLVLLDLMLPYGYSGYQAYEDIKRVPELAKIPTVLVTASDPSAELRKAQAKGFAGFISKPIRMHTFPNYLARILDGESVWAPS